jgi:hypothetical protein
LGRSGTNPLQKTNDDGNSQVKSPEENLPFTALQMFNHLIPEEEGKMWEKEGDK